jgi:hypothetical protein
MRASKPLRGVNRSRRKKRRHLTLPPAPKKQDAPKIEIPDQGDDEHLITGYVQGKEARKAEEFMAMAFDELEYSYDFRVEVETPLSLPGRPREIDFIVTIGVKKALEMDGPFHNTFEQGSLDQVRDAVLIEPLLELGVIPPVIHVKSEEVTNFESAMKAARRM